MILSRVSYSQYREIIEHMRGWGYEDELCSDCGAPMDEHESDGMGGSVCPPGPGRW